MYTMELNEVLLLLGGLAKETIRFITVAYDTRTPNSNLDMAGWKT
jgi:hypothetical protein